MKKKPQNIHLMPAAFWMGFKALITEVEVEAGRESRYLRLNAAMAKFWQLSEQLQNYADLTKPGYIRKPLTGFRECSSLSPAGIKPCCRYTVLQKTAAFRSWRIPSITRRICAPVS